MILNRLRPETKHAHQELEKLLIPRIKSTATIAEYSELLRLFYGYFKPVETRIADHINDNILPDHNERRKSEMLLSDLHTVSGNTAGTTLCTDLPTIENINHALGAMYVLEGSTLGGKIISQMLSKNLAIAPNEGISFFSGYGEETDEKWNTFTSALNNYLTDSKGQDEIVTAANETFEKFKSWIEASN